MRNAASIPVSVEMLCDLLHLPKDVKIIGATATEFEPGGIPRTISIQVESPNLPEIHDDSDLPIITPTYRVTNEKAYTVALEILPTYTGQIG